MLSNVSAGRTVGVHKARGEWSELVAEAKEGSAVVLTHEDEAAAVLAPLAWLEAAAGQRPAVVETPVSAARTKLGELVRDAAQGVPQVLTRYGHPVAVMLPGPGQSQTPTPSAPPASGQRRLVAASDALSAQPFAARLSFGLPALDAAVRGISASRLTLIAGNPGVGASLLAVAAARQTALVEERGGVLYAASGLGQADVVARLVASHAGVSYHQWRAGTLPDPEAAAARLAETAVREHGDTLFIDAGSGLDASVISEVALDDSWSKPLTLVVVDRLQRAADARLPLSGVALEEAARDLAHLARQAQVPVLAVVDSDDADLLAALDADVTLTLTRMGQAARIDVAERGMGRLTSVALEPDIPRARFLPLPDHIAQRLLREDTSSLTRAAPRVADSAPAHPDTQDVAGTPGPTAALDEDAQEAQQPADQPGSPAQQQRRPGAWPAAVTDAAAATARATAADTAAGTPAADEPAAQDLAPADEQPVPEQEPVPDDERAGKGFDYGPFAVIDGRRRAHLTSGKMIPCPATTVRELVAWAADRPFGTPRLHPSGRDGDPLIVLTAEAARALGLPERTGEDRALPVDHPIIADLTAHGWEMPQRGNKPWFSAWVRVFQRIERGRRSVQLAVLPWGALTSGGWPLPIDRETRLPVSTTAEVVDFLRVYSERIMTPVSSTAATGQELMSALRPATRAWREEETKKVRSKWLEGSLHLAVDPAPPEATKDHPLAAGRDPKDPAQFLQEEALQWWRLPTEEERGLPYVVCLDTMMAFFAACNGTPMGTCAPYHLPRAPFDKKLVGSWLADLSGVQTDPLLPSPFTPDGTRPSGPAWYQTHTVALAVELGHTPQPMEAYVRPTAEQAKALGISPHPDRYDERRRAAGPVPAFGAGPYLKPWYEHINDGYMQTMTALGAVTHDDGSPLSPSEFLDAMAKMDDPDFRATHATDLLVLKAIKQTVKGAIGKYQQGPQDYGRRAAGQHARWKTLDRPDWRPDHRAAILARYRAVMNRKIINTFKATGARPLAVNTDAIVFASPIPDILWLTGHKGGFAVGPNPGHVKLEGVQSMDWYLQVTALNKNPASRAKDGRTDSVLDGK
ncbi:DnaB-like helicase C-terminal domain-containing protein [Streptomyces cathayae]|uniref:DnaB-like helicase C-terminal domain-containing protein n=1 Tax=Streptomyces cathayae TaxID=3031124 RepID=A0ABY8KE87_9ACTN|nr:DnaB-like helicase C-terminal domain-containing protein [Streptomyces sp. HUAS 5]WGD45146.1 DnaB-like helicase C-terminal domain-containing protein [Streptomyces sp. HUAS 5]